ncbi:MAG: recombinase family protein [Oscillospiraceae bacterium]|nr:recombinase family protein [Oscillospiraceae bacterium]
MRKNGVRVISATESISDDSTGILLESMLEGYAEFYSAELSEKIKRGMTENALKCKFNGGGLVVGYYIDDDRYFQLDPLTSPIIRQAFEKYADGGTVKSITKWLNDSGVKNTLGKPMTANTVTHTLKNRTYIGEYHHGEHIIPNGVPALVDDALFNRVQERFERNKKMPTHFRAEDEYILTTKLFCGKCGNILIGESGKSRTGAIHRYYKCSTAKRKHKCDLKAVKKDWIEDFVIGEVKKTLVNDKLLEHIADSAFEAATRENSVIPLLRQRLADTEKQIENMLTAIAAGVLTPSTKKKLNDLEFEKEDLEIRLLQEEMSQNSLTREQILFWLHKFRNADISDREVRIWLIDCFVNAVYVYDDNKIVPVLNYRDGADPATANDIDAAFGSTMMGGAPPLKVLALQGLSAFLRLGVVLYCAV